VISVLPKLNSLIGIPNPAKTAPPTKAMTPTMNNRIDIDAILIWNEGSRLALPIYQLSPSMNEEFSSLSSVMATIIPKIPEIALTLP
jgi:hypothetical protein